MQKFWINLIICCYETEKLGPHCTLHITISQRIMTLFIVQKTIKNGYGLARNSKGKKILVEEGLPGEQLLCKIIDSKKHYDIAKIKKIIVPHPERIEPPCPYSGECGGCNFQHSSYKLQTRLKTEIIRDILSRSGNKQLADAGKDIAQCIQSDEHLYYRQRIRLQVNNMGALGFLKKKSNEIILIKKCLLTKKQINSCLREIKNCQEFNNLLENCKQLEMLHNPVTDKVNLLFHFTRKPRPRDLKQASLVCEKCSTVQAIYFKGEQFPLTKPIAIPEISSSLMQYPFSLEKRKISLCWEVGSFCQVNLKQNISMIKTVLNFAAPNKNDKILDLYCGMGNFSIPLASLCKSVIGYEGQGAAIRAAKHNARINSADNTSFHKKPVHIACDELCKNNRTYDTIVIDPPRQGAPELAAQLAKLASKKIVYISCDPATLCRDLKGLIEQRFTVKKIQPIDMFPQTHHIETVVLLQKHD